MISQGVQTAVALILGLPLFGVVILSLASAAVLGLVGLPPDVDGEG